MTDWTGRVLCEFPSAPQPPGRTELSLSPVTGTSRKIGDDGWYRITPGTEGRLIAVGYGREAFAWIDVRPERPATAGGVIEPAAARPERRPAPQAATLFDEGDAP